MGTEEIKGIIGIIILMMVILGNYIMFRTWIRNGDEDLQKEYKRGYEDGLNDAVRMIDSFVKDNEEDEVDQDK